MPPAEPQPPGAESETLSAAEPRADAAPDLTGSACIAGYELLGELGRGGMGVVYKARQTKLHRLVALKMILAGGHAGAADLTRFRTEGEAIARLQHPNIVQVYEVGEHEGRPYFSLEFCGGGSLEQRLDGTPLEPRAAAQLIETLARAMDAAHRQHVVHRDLKPANVLLTEAGVPKITDFGLAKKLDAIGEPGASATGGLTQTGSIMGTPSYMAPEQAGGKTKEIGPATDVYALGAILYELLTGRPPFKAATPLDTVLQVVADEPVPPARLQSKTPRDLETICLKCLHKEPGKRYVTAAALAEDLRRFQAGEPIQARPVSRTERATKWVRRNPALAGAAAAVTLALLLGTAVSTYFGMDASREAEKAKNNEADAIAKGNELATANENLTRTADDLKRSRDDLETALVQSLLRPLAQTGDDKAVNAAELGALWDLARHRDDRLRSRFVEEALATPTTSRQLRARAALALHAAVGLDANRRAKVEDLLLARLDDPALGEAQKVDVALAASAWEALSVAGSRRTARELAQAMTRTKSLAAPLAQGLSTAAARLEPREAIAILTQALKETNDPQAVSFLAQGLSQVAARLDPKDAAQAAAALLQAMKDNTKDASLLWQLAQSLSKVVARLGPKDAAAATASAVTILTQAAKETQDPNALVQLAGGLSALAAHLDPEGAAPASAALTRAINKANGPSAWRRLPPEDLSLLAAHLGAKEAASITALTVADLIEEMTTTASPFYLEKHPMTRMSAFLSGAPPAAELRSRSDALSSVVCSLGMDGYPLNALARLIPVAEPLPCRLSTEQLVELLKMPTCIGAARRLVLNQLGNRYRRPFTDIWEFVGFAKEHNLGLDFTTPPQRPEPAAAKAKSP